MSQRPPAPEFSSAGVLGLGTALPAFLVDQSAAARAVGRLTGRPRRVARTFALAGVATRYACVADFDPDRPGPLARLPAPSTAERMTIFAREAPLLAAVAARRALDSAGLSGDAIGHLVVVTCTGFSAPGVDLALVDALGLPPDVDRTVVGFMGCHGAFNGLRAARGAVAATGRAALVVCVELGSLHVQPASSREALVSASLFGDGAAAVVVGADAGRGALLRLTGGASHLAEGTRDAMSWSIGPNGFVMSLAPTLPAAVASAVRLLADRLGIDGVDPAGLCVHPGGPAVLDRVEDALGLQPGALDVSRDALREHGNLSSATILFVLARVLPELTAGAPGLLLGFGPGLTVEGLGFVRGTRPFVHRRVAIPVAIG